jgi:DNA polymerase III subunit beta
MRITLQRDLLADAAAVAARAISGKSTLPILQHLHFAPNPATGTLMVTGTDLEMWAQKRIPASLAANLDDADLPDAELSFTLPAKAIAELLSKLPAKSSVTLEREAGSNKIAVTCERTNLRLLGLPGEEFPVRMGENDKLLTLGCCSLSGDLLASVLRSVAFAQSKNDQAPKLCSVCLRREEDGTLTAVATDTSRMAIRQGVPLSVYAGQPWEILLPSRGAAEWAGRVKGAEKASIEVFTMEQDGKQTINCATLTIGDDTSITTRLVQERYPDWRRIIPPSHNKTLTFETEALTQCLQRVMIVGRENAAKVVFSTEGNQLSLSAESGILGDAEERIEIGRTGDDIRFALNGQYFLDALSAVETEGCVLECTEAIRATTLRPLPGNGDTNDPAITASGEWFCLLMPLQLI